MKLRRDPNYAIQNDPMRILNDVVLNCFTPNILLQL